MSRILAASVLAVLGLAAAFLWYRHEQSQPLPEVQGSSTVEFVPRLPPAVRRPPPLVRTEPWPTYGYNNARTRYARDLTHRPPYRTLWSRGVGSLLEFPPIVSYGRVYAIHQHGRVVALDAETGKVAWQRRFPHCAASSPTAGGRVVYVALMQPHPCKRSPRTQRGFVAALDADSGKVLWRYPAGAVETSPLLVGKTLYFGSWDHHVYALDVSGPKPRLKWRFEADDEVHASPAYAGGRIFFGSDGGRAYALNARTGQMLWRSESYSRFGNREYFYAAPAVAYGRVFLGNTDGNVYAFGAGSGHLLWSSNAGTYVYTAPAVWNRTVLVGSYDGKFYAFDAATGDERWAFDAGASIHGAPSVISGIVYFATCGTCGHRGSRPSARGPRATFALNARTGRLVWRFPHGHYSPVVADAERLYVAGSARIFALDERRRPGRP